MGISLPWLFKKLGMLPEGTFDEGLTFSKVLTLPELDAGLAGISLESIIIGLGKLLGSMVAVFSFTGSKG